MPAAAPYPLPGRGPALVRQGEARDLPAAVVADGMALLAALPAGPARDAVLAVVRMARPDVLREERRREGARLIELYMAEGYRRQAAREKAAPAVGVSEAALREWGL
ncbi:MAG: hypothetical protein IPO09_09055 [Anaeromyxobacter sp.]|nr:hypothetical protein [Anaeromyxobacter sp.]